MILIFYYFHSYLHSIFFLFPPFLYTHFLLFYLEFTAFYRSCPRFLLQSCYPLPNLDLSYSFVSITVHLAFLHPTDTPNLSYRRIIFKIRNVFFSNITNHRFHYDRPFFLQLVIFAQTHRFIDLCLVDFLKTQSIFGFHVAEMSELIWKHHEKKESMDICAYPHFLEEQYIAELYREKCEQLFLPFLWCCYLLFFRAGLIFKDILFIYLF